MVVNHANHKTRREYLPIIKDACEKNEANWNDFAQIQDRILLEEGKKQIYGTQMEFDERLKKYVPQSLEDPKNVNARRAAIGLDTIEAQLKKFSEANARDLGQ